MLSDFRDHICPFFKKKVLIIRILKLGLIIIKLLGFTITI